VLLLSPFLLVLLCLVLGFSRGQSASTVSRALVAYGPEQGNPAADAAAATPLPSARKRLSSEEQGSVSGKAPWMCNARHVDLDTAPKDGYDGPFTKLWPLIQLARSYLLTGLFGCFHCPTPWPVAATRPLTRVRRLQPRPGLGTAKCLLLTELNLKPELLQPNKYSPRLASSMQSLNPRLGKQLLRFARKRATRRLGFVTKTGSGPNMVLALRPRMPSFRSLSTTRLITRCCTRQTFSTGSRS